MRKHDDIIFYICNIYLSLLPSENWCIKLELIYNHCSLISIKKNNDWSLLQFFRFVSKKKNLPPDSSDSPICVG